MAHIDNLKERLLGDARQSAEAIHNEAKAKADEIVREATKKAEALLESNRVKSERDGLSKKERMIARAQLDVRNSLLEAKQQTIERVLSLAVEKLSTMGSAEYSSYMEKLLMSSVETGDEEVIFSLTDKTKISGDLIERVNSALTAAGRKGMLKLSSETANVSSGFILRRGGLEINCSIQSILRTLREDLEGELSGLMFEGQN